MRECLTWITRLKAEESLLEVRRVAVGTGSLKKGVGDEVIGQWAAIAKPNKPIPAAMIETRQKQIKDAGIKVFGAETPTP